MRLNLLSMFVLSILFLCLTGCISKQDKYYKKNLSWIRGNHGSSDSERFGVDTSCLGIMDMVNDGISHKEITYTTVGRVDDWGFRYLNLGDMSESEIMIHKDLYQRIHKPRIECLIKQGAPKEIIVALIENAIENLGYGKYAESWLTEKKNELEGEGIVQNKTEEVEEVEEVEEANNDNETQKAILKACKNDSKKYSEECKYSDATLLCTYCEKLAIDYRNHKKSSALLFFKEQCKKQKGWACNQLGYIFSVGAERNFTTSFQFLTKGCKLGDGQACLSLSVFYNPLIEGFQAPSITKNLQKSLHFAERGCKKGSPSSCRLAGSMQKRFKKNKQKSMQFLKKGCRLGDQKSCQYIKKFKHMSKTKKQQRKEQQRCSKYNFIATYECKKAPYQKFKRRMKYEPFYGYGNNQCVDIKGCAMCPNPRLPKYCTGWNIIY